jgi:hypothetical protein
VKVERTRGTERLISQAAHRLIRFANRKSLRYVAGMSSAIGFTPAPPNEIEALREAYSSLNDVARNLTSVAQCLKREDLRMADHHLRAAEWHVGQAKQRIEAVGQSKSEDKGRLASES